MTTTTVTVPLNTMLADLDESLRELLKRELGRHGFDGVEIVFDAPGKEWSASLSSPTVNLFLYDIRENAGFRPADWEPRGGNGNVQELRPPLRVDTSYAVTAWTRAVEDEHRLLSQVLAVLYAYPELPRDVLKGTLVNGSQRYPLKARIGQEKQDKADFWSSVGGQYKASLDYVVTLSCEPGMVLERGPEVRTQTVRLFDREGPRSVLEEMHRVGGVVRDEEGEPVANAWVVLPDSGSWRASDAEGKFRFDRLSAGTYRCLARTADGGEGEAELVVPGGGVDLTVRAAKAGGKSKR